MNPQLEQLHDIEGIDLISYWPLAPGWWALMAVAIVVAAAGVYGVFRYLGFRSSWKRDTLQKLTALEKNLSHSNARSTAITLSEYLRRIALQRFDRDSCAGLTGDAWLQWLTQNDPNQFNWEKKGAWLIDVPYAPLSLSLSVDQVNELIQAVRHWVR